MSDFNVDVVFEEGMTDLKKQSWSKAIEKFTGIIDSSEEVSPVVFLKRGLAFMGQQWWDEAIYDFRRALEMGLSDADVFAGLARTYRLKGWWDESIHFWGAALELNDDNADYFFSRGLAYFYKGWFNEAIEHFLAASHIDPTNPEIAYAMAVALNCRGQAEESKVFLEKAIEKGGVIYGKIFEQFSSSIEITDEMVKTCGGKKGTKKSASKKAPAKKAAKKSTKEKKVSKTTKAAKPKKAAKSKKSSAKKTKKKGSMLDAAEFLLEEAGDSLHYKILTREAISRKLIDTAGSTPEQSMRSAISRDISRKGDNARFFRDPKKKGHYRLTKWNKK